MEEIESKLSALKAEIDTIRESGIWRGYRWSDEIKKQVQNLHRSGVSGARLSKETGICIETLHSWWGEQKKKKAVKKPVFKEFEVRTEEIKIHVVNDRGTRIEGLRLNEVKELLFSRAL